MPQLPSRQSHQTTHRRAAWAIPPAADPVGASAALGPEQSRDRPSDPSRSTQPEDPGAATDRAGAAHRPGARLRGLDPVQNEAGEHRFAIARDLDGSTLPPASAAERPVPAPDRAAVAARRGIAGGWRRRDRRSAEPRQSLPATADQKPAEQTRSAASAAPDPLAPAAGGQTPWPARLLGDAARPMNAGPASDSKAAAAQDR